MKIIHTKEGFILNPNTDESNILAIISEYINNLTRVSSEDLFSYIADELTRITGAKAAAVNSYDPLKKELCCRHVNLSAEKSSKLSKVFGHGLLETRVPVSDEFYAVLCDRRIKTFSNLNLATNGAIPKTVSLFLEKLIGVDRFVTANFFIDDDLIGTVLLAGKKEKLIYSNDLLTPLAAATANVIELKETEALLKQGREWYRVIAEDIPAMVVRVSPQLKFTFANNAYSIFMGKPPEEIIGDNLSAYIPPNHYQQVVGHFNILTFDKPIDSHEHINIRHDGSLRWIKWINRALFDIEGRVKEYLCIGEDITEQKQAFQMLQESEAMKSSIIEAIPDLIICHDLEGHCLNILSSRDDLLYLPREKIIGKKLDELLPRGLAETIKAEIEKAVQTKELRTIEFTMDTVTGPREFESRLIASSDKEVISFVRDLTDQKSMEKELRKSEDKQLDILASIEEGYYEVDLNGILTYCNDATPRMLGYTREEMIGMSYKQFYRDPETVFKTYNRVFQSGKPDRGFTLEMVCKDGNSRYGELSISLIKDKAGNITGFRGVARDITDRFLFEKKLEYMSMHDQLTGLHNRAYFEQEMARLNENPEYPVSMISVDLDDLKLVNDSLGHDVGDKLLQNAAVILNQSVRSQDILARVGGDEFTIILPRTDEQTAESIAAQIRNNLEEYNRSNASFPLGLSIGLATTSDARTTLLNVFKLADDHMYHDKLARSNQVRNKTVEALLAALAERDYITEGHIQRLSDLCLKVGEKLNLSSRQLSDLALLAQIHDIGKVGMPDKVLFKNGSLTDEEWKTMRLHPEKGYRIAISSPDLSAIAVLILKHHERWDGSGYPMGLKGENIPIECRILALVDSFDAMTNNRPYSDAVDNREALEEIKKCAGTQFDPILTEIFVSLFEEEQINAY